MYGMMNEGIRCLVSEKFGEDTWEQVLEVSGVDVESFERLNAYPDEVTYNLVKTICGITSLGEEDVLREFGRYWIDFAGKSGFGSLMRMAGHDFVSRLRGLDAMHERIALTMPHLKPPSFEVAQFGENVYQLSYYSERVGFAPMVLGQLYGMAAMSGETIRARHVTPKRDVSEPDIFEIELLAA